jgi:lipoate-protein ligase B
LAAIWESSVGCMERSCQAYNVGLLDYADGLLLQKELVQARLRGEIIDTLLLCEHPTAITIGKSGKEENLLVNSKTLCQQGIMLHYTDRGGDITVHSPGQLVGYPIVDAANRQINVHSYMYQLEETIIRTLCHFRINADRVPKHRGVWVKGQKICSIGVKFTRSVTSHGFALNVNNDLNYFSLICPCGIQGVKMTSVSKVTGREVTVEEVLPSLVEEFFAVFQPIGLGVSWNNRAGMCRSHE